MSKVVTISVDLDSIPESLMAKALTEYLTKRSVIAKAPMAVPQMKKVQPVKKQKRTKLRSDSKIHQKMEELTKHYGNAHKAAEAIGLHKNTFSFIRNKRVKKPAIINKIMEHKAVKK